jgi:CRISPR-associated protein (TIGR02710 family)
VYAERQMERARLLFNKLDFVAAMELTDTLRRILPEGPLKQRAKTIWMLSEAYDLWERFRWKDASHKLSKVANPREGLVGVSSEKLQNNAEFTLQVSQREYDFIRLVELWRNANRRYTQGRYDDALSRMYRAFEYLPHMILMTRYQIHASDAKEADFQRFELCEATREQLRHNARRNGGVIKLGLRAAIELLAELGDAVGLDLYMRYWKAEFRAGQELDPKEHSNVLQNWLNQRNRSLLAHGTTPADPETVRGLLGEYKALLERHIPSETLRQYMIQSEYVTI